MNTKTQLSLGELRGLFADLRSDAELLRSAGFVPFLPEGVLGEAAGTLSPVGMACGAQDVWPTSKGHVTGAAAAELLAELGCTYVLVGHQDRRRVFGESDRIVAEKAAAGAAQGLVPFVCVGEGEWISAEEAAAVVVDQFDAVLAALDGTTPLVVMYEPAWTIGADRPAEVDRVAAVVGELRSRTADRSGPVRVLYGGSVTSGVYSSFRSACTLDGVGLGRVALRGETRRAVLQEVLDQG